MIIYYYFFNNIIYKTKLITKFTGYGDCSGRDRDTCTIIANTVCGHEIHFFMIPDSGGYKKFHSFVFHYLDEENQMQKKEIGNTTDISQLETQKEEGNIK